MKKRILSLGLCLCLLVGAIPAALGAQLVYFPELSKSLGVMEADGAWPDPASSMVPTQTYMGVADWDDCLDYARQYIDILVDTGDFEVASPFKVVYGKEGSDTVNYAADLRYTGSAAMKGTLKAVRADKSWPDYGAYHITVRAERDATRPNAMRRNSIVLRWDSALRPEGIDYFADPDTKVTVPDEDTATPDKGTTTPDKSNAVGNSDNTFQTLDSAMGWYLTTEDGGYFEDKSQDPADFDTLRQFAQEYVDLLVGQDNFYLVSRRKDGRLVTREDVSWSGGASSTWHIRYVGTAAMTGNLESGGYLDWSHYGPFHLEVAVWKSEKSNYITVAWDDGLEPVERDRRTPSGAKLGSAEKPGETVTAVLRLGYPKMCVGREVVPVDDLNPNVYPVAENGRTLVPVSRIVAAFGGQSTWDGKTNNTTYTLGNRSVSHVIGSKEVVIQSGGQRQKKTMEAPSKAMNDRTYIPVRYVLEGLGLWVGYESKYGLVIVSNQSQAGEDLVELAESQRLFNSEEVPKYPSKTLEHYTIDGYNYTMEVGEALTLFNSRTAISGYYAYTWDVLDGGELVSVDRYDATCKFYAKRPGVVTIQSHLDQTVVGSTYDFSSTYTMTITIVPATGLGSPGGLMTWQPCDFCGGTGKMQVGSRTITCTKCLGNKQILQ